MKQVWKYIQSDYYRYTGKILSPMYLTLKAFFSYNHCFRYTYWLRLASPLTGHSLLHKFASLMHRHYSLKYGIQIPSCTKIGYGFYIGHGVGVVINGRTKIGNNVNISQFLSIGSVKGTPAIVGDNVYIGPHVSIVEDVNIGDNSLIAAGATVIRDVPDNKTVAGCPATVKGENRHLNFVGNRWTDFT